MYDTLTIIKGLKINSPQKTVFVLGISIWWRCNQLYSAWCESETKLNSSSGAKEPLALSALMQNVSLADELHEAELVHEGHFPLTSSPRPADSLVLLRPKGPCPSNRHSFINLEELGSPDQVDPLHKQQLDESLTNFDNCDKSCCGYDSRGTQSQMELSIHEELVQCQQEEEAEPAEMAPVIDRTLSDTLGNMDFNAQSLPPRSTYMCQDSSPPELKSKVHQSSSPSGGSSHSDHSMRQNGKDDSKESTGNKWILLITIRYVDLILTSCCRQPLPVPPPSRARSASVRSWKITNPPIGDATSSYLATMMKSSWKLVTPSTLRSKPMTCGVKVCSVRLYDQKRLHGLNSLLYHTLKTDKEWLDTYYLILHQHPTQIYNT